MRQSNRPSYLIVKLAAAGDVLLATALARALRQARPDARIGWITSTYAAPLLAANPDLDAVTTLPAGRAGPLARGRSGGAWLTALLGWRVRHGPATVLLAHRSPLLYRSARAVSGFRVVAPEFSFPFQPAQHRLQWLAALLAAAGVEVPALSLWPHLELNDAERRAGEQIWHGCGTRPRWVIAAGGADNPWSAMPNRCWSRERFFELAQRALGAGVALRWIGGGGDRERTDWICQGLPPDATANWTGRLSLRQSAAVIAAADLVVGNDSLPLVMAHALHRPALGIYGPTSGAAIHAPGQPWVQGRTDCCPCYDPRAGTRGLAYTCPRARCMEQISVDAVWQRAHPYLTNAAVFGAAG